MTAQRSQLARDRGFDLVGHDERHGAFGCLLLGDHEEPLRFAELAHDPGTREGVGGAHDDRDVRLERDGFGDHRDLPSRPGGAGGDGSTGRPSASSATLTDTPFRAVNAHSTTA